ncbi:MAG: M20/M25/M40 family metallo-hydrolase [Vulcanimicrobiota bacterium]
MSGQIICGSSAESSLISGIHREFSTISSLTAPQDNGASAGRTTGMATETDSFDRSDEIVNDTMAQWKHQGKKYGTLSAATIGSIMFSTAAAAALPSIAGLLMGPAGFVLGMALTGIEEKYIGIGKRAGAIIGSAAGFAAGQLKAGWEKDHPSSPECNDRKIELPKAPPSGKGAKEPLMLSLLHKAEKKVFGRVPERNNTIERAEAIGATISYSLQTLALPGIAATVIGGPVGLICSTFTGNLLGFALGGYEENTIGLGRAAGEIAGTIISHIKDKTGKGGKEREAAGNPPCSADIPSAEGAGVMGKISGIAEKVFMPLSTAMLETAMFLINDSSDLLNLTLQEKPVQTVEFTERSFPSVNRKRLTDNFIRLAGIPGVYQHEKAIADELEKQLTSMKISHKRDEAGNVIASIPAKGVTDSPAILLSAHMDTLSETAADAIFNDGRRISTDEKHILGADDRSGIAEILEGVNIVMEKGFDHPAITLVFTVGEEVGLIGASKLNSDDLPKGPALGFVMDCLNVRDLHLANDSVVTNGKSPKYNYSQENPIVQLAMRSMAEGGTMPRPMHAPIMAGCGTDANTYKLNSDNITSMALGSGMTDVHTPLENILIDDLEHAARTVVGVLTNSCDLKVNEAGDVVSRFSPPVQKGL